MLEFKIRGELNVNFFSFGARFSNLVTVVPLSGLLIAVFTFMIQDRNHDINSIQIKANINAGKRKE